MDVFSTHQQLHHGSTCDILHTDTGLYDYIDGSSPFSTYAAHLQAGNLYQQEDSTAGSDATTADAVDIQLQHCDSTDCSQTSSQTVIYPWMKQHRRRNGNVLSS